MVLGQDQDQRGEGFNPVESFVGSISQLNIWDRVLTPQQVNKMVVSGFCFLFFFFFLNISLYIKSSFLSLYYRSGCWLAAVQILMSPTEEMSLLGQTFLLVWWAASK